MGRPRYLAASRSQLGWEMVDLDSQLPPDHEARVVWSFVETLDLSKLYDAIRSVRGHPGRPAADPKILLALWLYATLDGVGAARHLAELCKRHAAYRWLCGGVPMNYHSLSDFRVAHGEFLDRLLSHSVAALVSEGLVKLEDIAIDGTKVKASAGKGSFRGASKLAELEAVAATRVATLKRQVAADPGAERRRTEAARKRAAEDLARRIGKARETAEKLEAEKAARAKTHKTDEATKNERRVSVTDPEARIMKFADGAYRAGYNMQIATDIDSGVILGVEATDRRIDTGMAIPMVDQIRARYDGCQPRRVLADSRYVVRKDIPVLADKGISVYTPVPADKPSATLASLRRREKVRMKEPDCVKEWRARMAGDEAKETYKRRARIETINDILKNRGLAVLRVRSAAKAQCILLLHAIAHNLRRGHFLRTAAAVLRRQQAGRGRYPIAGPYQHQPVPHHQAGQPISPAPTAKTGRQIQHAFMPLEMESFTSSKAGIQTMAASRKDARQQSATVGCPDSLLRWNDGFLFYIRCLASSREGGDQTLGFAKA